MPLASLLASTRIQLLLSLRYRVEPGYGWETARHVSSVSFVSPLQLVQCGMIIVAFLFAGVFSYPSFVNGGPFEFGQLVP